MTRLRRSCLTVPASSEKMLAKARSLPADEVIVDLEDSIAVADKNDATRARAAEALQGAGWRTSTRAVRINAVGSPWCLRDVLVVVEHCGSDLDCIVMPKVEDASEVHFLSHLLDHLEGARDDGRRIGLEAQIETPRGLVEVERIGGASDRLEALVFGPGDFAAALGARQLRIGEPAADYPGDQWHYARSRIAATARAFGLQPIDGPYSALDDGEGLVASARQAAALGFDGKWVIHPGQIAACNEVFSPSADEVRAAEALVAAYDGATEHGVGASRHEGAMIDEASLRMAEGVLARARAAPAEAE